MGHLWTPRLDPTRVPTVSVEIDWTHSLASGLLGFWLLGLGPRDYTGLSGSAVLSGASGVAGTAQGPQAAFNGTDTQVTLPTSSRLASLSKTSVEAWCTYSSNAGQFQTVFSQSGIVLVVESAGPSSFTVYSRFNLTFSNTVSVNAVAGAPLQYVGTYDGSTGIAYVNGNNSGAFASVTGSCNLSGAVVGNWYTISRYLKGTAGKVSIYSRALPAPQVAWLSAEPFAMLRPKVRRAWSFPSSSSAINASATAGAGTLSVAGESGVASAGAAALAGAAVLTLAGQPAEAGASVDATASAATLALTGKAGEASASAGALASSAALSISGQAGAALVSGSVSELAGAAAITFTGGAGASSASSAALALAEALAFGGGGTVAEAGGFATATAAALEFTGQPGEALTGGSVAALAGTAALSLAGESGTAESSAKFLAASASLSATGAAGAATSGAVALAEPASLFIEGEAGVVEVGGSVTALAGVTALSLAGGQVVASANASAGAGHATFAITGAPGTGKVSVSALATVNNVTVGGLATLVRTSAISLSATGGLAITGGAMQAYGQVNSVTALTGAAQITLVGGSMLWPDTIPPPERAISMAAMTRSLSMRPMVRQLP